MADPLGQYLKRAREAKGLTLEQAAAKTRILPDYLRAVEEDNYARLPEEVFAKGFVRSYASCLGLDEMEVLQKFNESGGQFYAKKAEREQLKHQLLEEERRKRTNQLIVVGMVGLALIVLFLVTGQDREGAKSRSEVPSEPPAMPRTSVPASGPTRPDPAARPEPPRTDITTRPESTEPPPRGEPLPRGEPGREIMPPTPIEVERNLSQALPLEGIAPDREKLVLDVEAIERSWVLVKADHNPAQDVMLSPGERVRWSAQDRLSLTLGNAGGVRVSLNGKPQGPYGGSGKVVKDLVFTR
jgi:cytoskeletal protein RodZ